MPKLLIATTNAGKLEEYRILLQELSYTLVSLSDLGIREVAPETGRNFTENAVQKAIFYSQRSGLITLADDGGLEIDCLNGAPGVESNRWLGHGASDQEMVKGILQRLKGIPEDKRGAQFRAIVAIAVPGDEKIYTFEGILRGLIVDIAISEIIPGLPYRSIFYLPEVGRVFSKLSIAEGTALSHRKQAMEKAKHLLQRVWHQFPREGAV